MHEVTSERKHASKFWVVLENLKNLKFFNGHDIYLSLLTGWFDVSLYVGMQFFPRDAFFWPGRLFSLHGTMKEIGPLLNTRVWPIKQE